MSYTDPTTWPSLGEIDPDLVMLLSNGARPRFDKEYTVESIVPTRAQWDPIYKDAARKALEHPSVTNVTHKTIQIPRRDGSSARALLYQPTDPSENSTGGSPLLVLFHGGGFCFGCPEMEARNCINAVQLYGMVALSVEYRLAPEAKFPTAVEDAWDAVRWIAANASTLGANPAAGFILGGTSAGGNITAVLSHLARDEGLSPPLTGIYLNIPLLLDPAVVPSKYTTLYKSRDQNKHAPILPSEAMTMYAEAYEPTLTSPLWSPAIWPTGHKDLPPTYFQICGMDILRDEALIYERMLGIECAIETRVHVYPGLPHVFYANFPEHPRAKGYAGDAARGIGWLLGVSKMI